jgi:alanine racemase
MEGLEPVVRSITTRLSHVASHRAARRVGVGGACELAAGSRTGVVSLGRGDGYRWHADQPASMLVRGRRAPVLGLSLEHVVLDLTSVPAAQPGDDVVVLGLHGDASITLAELADWRRSSPVGTLLDFAGRVERRYETA